MTSYRSVLSGYIAFALAALTGTVALAQSVRTTPNAAFFRNLWVTRSPIGSIKDFPIAPNAPTAILLNEADETRAINIIIQRKTGTFSADELNQIAAGLHLGDLSSMYKTAAGDDGNARPALDPDFVRNLTPFIGHIILSSPNINASRQLRELLTSYLPGATAGNLIQTGFMACNTANAFRIYDFRCPATSEDAPDASVYSKIPIEVTLAKISEITYDIGAASLARQVDGFFILDQPIQGTYGFAALVMTRGNDIVLSIRGTDFDHKGQAIRNLYADAAFATNGMNGELEMDLRQAVELLVRINQLYSNANVYITGHSLGGGIAEILGQATGLPTATFNAPGAEQLLGPTLRPILAELNGLHFSNSGKIVNYRTDGDRVSLTGRHFGYVCTIAQPTPFKWDLNSSLEVNHKIKLMVNDIQNRDLARYPDVVAMDQKMPPSVPCQHIN